MMTATIVSQRVAPRPYAAMRSFEGTAARASVLIAVTERPLHSVRVSGGYSTDLGA